MYIHFHVHFPILHIPTFRVLESLYSALRHYGLHRRMLCRNPPSSQAGEKDWHCSSYGVVRTANACNTSIWDSQTRPVRDEFLAAGIRDAKSSQTVMPMLFLERQGKFLVQTRLHWFRGRRQNNALQL